MRFAAARRRRRALIQPRPVLAIACMLTLVGLTGCSPTPVETPAPPKSELTLAHARKLFATFITADDVARAAGEESLELSLVSQAQLPLTVAGYERAGYSGGTTARYSYGRPRVYVPQMKSFPLWFAAVVQRTPVGGGSTRTAIMVFSRPEATDSWQLSLSTLLLPGMSLPPIALDKNGYAIALATFEADLLVSPNSVGAVQAAVANDGPASRAAALVAPGPYTTGLHERIVNAKRQVTGTGVTYDSAFGGTAFPLYALRTTDGGGLVLYSLNRSTARLSRHPPGPEIPVPPAFAPILYATGRQLVRTELDTTETYQYGAYVPASQPRRSTGETGSTRSTSSTSSTSGTGGTKLRVIAVDGGPTGADGT
jgi:hypothetical protein